MAATDQTYRNQKTLDLVFGASCVLMLISIIWMFADDYNREWKKEQRAFRDVEEAMAERFALARLPDPGILVSTEDEVKRQRDRLDKQQYRLDEIKEEIDALRAPMVIRDNDIRGVKADLDAAQSAFDIEVDKHGPESDRARRLKEDVRAYREKLDAALAKYDDLKRQLKRLEAERDRIQKPLQEAEARLKKLREDFDMQVKNARQKRWKTGDWFRNLPILDAFNSPTRIQQFTLNDLPIDYNFKYVTRFDRCTTCHLGIDKPGYDKTALHALARDPTQAQAKSKARGKSSAGQEQAANRLVQGQERIAKLKEEIRSNEASLKKLRSQLRSTKDKEERNDLKAEIGSTETTLKESRDRLKREAAYQERLEKLVAEIQTDGKLTTVDLPGARVNEFCVHPRLDLFVDANSPHPAEKFGCTSCHGGQGSATAFFYASHTPNDSAAKKRWQQTPKNGGHNWEADHDWEYPMYPRRFVESSCLKCHHQVTELIREGNKNEAPTLLRGYNLVRENGCFGCHEISGIKGGRSVGPDLRLEPFPALDQLSAEEQVKLRADPLNLPGTMRKVGPSLFRLREKTNPAWVKRWIKSPRSFRPTTKMPHFYGLSNNDKKALDETTQKAYPDAEVESIAHYLFYESTAYLNDADSVRRADYLKITEKFDKVYPLRKLMFRKQDLLQTRKKPSAREVKALDKQIAKVRTELRKANIDPETLMLFEDLLGRKAPTAPAKLKAWNKKELKDLKKAEADLALLKKTDILLKSTILNDTDKRELIEVKRQLELRGTVEPLASKLARSQGKARLPDDQAQQLKNGRRLFTEKGCLACHSHSAISKGGKGLMPDPNEPAKLVEVNLPAIDRERYYKDQPSVAAFGPNLSMIAAKLGTDEAGKDRKSRRSWLIQWIMDPTFHSPRTLMPVTHLSFEEAAAVTDWLLAQKPREMGDDWDEVEVKKSSLKTLQQLSRVYLDKALNDDEVKKLFRGGFTGQDMNSLLADERELARLIDSEARELKRPLKSDAAALVNPLKWYIGKKAINRLGCFGCHNIPGFEQAKPIGTPLNDWGKKDPERLAYEDIDHYLEHHYRFVDKQTGATIKKGQKPPYERYFKDEVNHRTRAGFLFQKLKEPRSYDYHRTRAWDDRLRMPQFKFARVKQLPGERKAAYLARADKEEASAREAVMTFILGLVAEPIPAKYVNAPGPDRLAEVKGRQVLDKYNCASCHQFRPGSYEFNLTPQVLRNLDQAHAREAPSYTTDHTFPEHNAWISPVAATPGRVTLNGMLIKRLDGQLMITLTEAARYARNPQQSSDLPANAAILVPQDRKSKKILDQAGEIPPLGGHFTDMLTPYLIKVYNQPNIRQENFKPDDVSGDNNYARGSLPPPLFHEGEKVQPNWLFQFLRNPQPIRPMVTPHLRMPRFNMSDDEAMALVNYFAAMNRVNNPGIGLTYPYDKVPQKDEDFLARRTQEYMARLKKNQAEYDRRLKELQPVWEQLLADQVTAEKQNLKEAEQTIKQAKDDAARKDATDLRNRVKARLQTLEDRAKNKDYKTQKEEWETQEAYARDGYRLLTNRDLCLKCHQIGNLEASQSLGGPPLHLAQDRLRPEWTLRWIAFPQRFLPYTSIMPTYFLRTDPKYQDVFTGTSLDQAAAARDTLMNFRKVADMPANRARPAAAAGGE